MKPTNKKPIVVDIDKDIMDIFDLQRQAEAAIGYVPSFSVGSVLEILDDCACVVEYKLPPLRVRHELDDLTATEPEPLHVRHYEVLHQDDDSLTLRVIYRRWRDA